MALEIVGTNNRNYISETLKDLTVSPTHSVTELEETRVELKKAYQAAKKEVIGYQEKQELLTNYRRALGKSQYLLKQAKIVEDHDGHLEKIIDSPTLTSYQRLHAVRSWVRLESGKAQKYSKHRIFLAPQMEVAKDLIEGLEVSPYFNNTNIYKSVLNEMEKASWRAEDKIAYLRPIEEEKTAKVTLAPLLLDILKSPTGIQMPSEIPVLQFRTERRA